MAGKHTKPLPHIGHLNLRSANFFGKTQLGFVGTIAGLGGGLFAAWGTFVNPAVFNLTQAAMVAIWVMVALTAFTVLQRVWHVRGELRALDEQT